MKKLALISMVVLLGSSGLLLAEAKVTWGGTFYTYGFFWNNADFDDDTKDGDMYYYMHGDIGATAEFENGLVIRADVTDWGVFGKHPISGAGQEGVGAHLREAYLRINNLFDSPVSFTIGKEHFLYGYQFFDGGEDGVTGIRFNLTTDVLDANVFAYRLEEWGGFYEKKIITDGDTIPVYNAAGRWGIIGDDKDLYGLYATAKLMDGKVNISGYAMNRQLGIAPDTVESPIWLGIRSEGSPIQGFNYVFEFTTMMGDNGMGVDYKGMHYMVQVGYTPANIPLTVGAAYLTFTGDDTETDENEAYENPLGGPYTYGFYKWWPGFGPAWTVRTPYGFACNPSNMVVINGNVGYSFGPCTIRLDFFKYDLHRPVKTDEKEVKNLFNEIGVFLLYNYKDVVHLGFTSGILMPNKDLWGDDATNALGGYFFVFKSF